MTTIARRTRASAQASSSSSYSPSVSSSSFTAFDFGELPLELRKEIALRFLPLPARLSLSLTSTIYWKLFWDPRIFKDINTWTFLDECAYYGFIEVLQEAVGQGVALDVLVLEEAIRGDWPDVFNFVRQNHRGLTLTFRGIIDKICELGAKKILFKHYSSVKATRYDLEQTAYHLLTNGHGDLCIDFLQTFHPNFEMWAILAQRAAKGRVFKLLGPYIPKKEFRSRYFLKELLEGACLGGDSFAAEFAVNLGAIPRMDYLEYMKTVTNLSILRLFFDKFPKMFTKKVMRNLVEDVMAFPRLDVLKFLVQEKHQAINAENFRVLVGGNFLYYRSMDELAALIREEKGERLACIRWLVAHGNLAFDVSSINYSALANFMSVEEIVSLLEFVCSPEVSKRQFYDRMFHDYILISERADPKVVKFFFENRGGAAITKMDLLMNVLFLENNLEILALLEELMGRSQFLAYVSLQNHWPLYMLTSSLFCLLDNKKPSHMSQMHSRKKLRPRYKNGMRVLEFLVSREARIIREHFMLHDPYLNKLVDKILPMTLAMRATQTFQAMPPKVLRIVHPLLGIALGLLTMSIALFAYHWLG